MVIEYFLDWVQTASVEKRTQAAGAMVRAFLNSEVPDDTREEIEAALTVLLDDQMPAVRLEIAESFGAHARAPRHIISMLAHDCPEVAIVVLSQSPVFHDLELIEFIKNGGVQGQVAISCRPWLAPNVVSAICEHAGSEAVTGLLMNPIADLMADDLHCIAERFGDDAEIRSMLEERSDLSAATRHLLITKLGISLAGMVSDRGWLGKGRAEVASRDALDRASIIFSASIADDEVPAVVQSLMQQERLTAAFLLRAICMGNINLVAASFAELSGVRLARVEAILYRNRISAFKALYERAGLPKSAFGIFHTAIATWQRLLSSGSKINQSRLPFLVTRELLANYSGRPEGIVDELLVLLRKLSAETARESSRAKALELSDNKRLTQEQTLAIEDQSNSDVLEYTGSDTVSETVEGVEIALIGETAPQPIEGTQAA